MRLTHPKSHTLDELRPLYEDFISLYPRMFAEWIEIERPPEKIEQDLLRNQQVAVFGFLKSKVEWDSNTTVLYAWKDFRLMLVDEFNIDHGKIGRN